MPYRVIIEFDLGERLSETWHYRVPRVLNFSDSLFYAFRNSDLASHDVQSEATAQLVVEVRSAAKLRRVEKMVEEMRREHFRDGFSRMRTEHQRP